MLNIDSRGNLEAGRLTGRQASVAMQVRDDGLHLGGNNEGVRNDLVFSPFSPFHSLLTFIEQIAGIILLLVSKINSPYLYRAYPSEGKTDNKNVNKITLC